MQRLIKEYNNAVQVLLSSDYNTFRSNLERFLNLLYTKEEFSSVLERELPTVDFDSWYENSRATCGSMVGSGVFNFPMDNAECLAMQLALLDAVSKEEKVDVIGFCHSFIYTANNFHVMVSDFLNQIVVPTLNNLEILFESTIKVEEVEKPVQVEITKTPEDPWYKKPLGSIGINMFTHLMTACIGFLLAKYVFV